MTPTQAEITKMRNLLERSQQLLEQCKPQVGMYLGEEISEYLADCKNERFNSKEYHFERMPTGQ